MKEYIFQIDNVSAGNNIVVANAPTGLVAKNILAVINKTTGKPVHSPIAQVIDAVTYSGTTMTITLDSNAPSIEGNLLIKAYTDEEGGGGSINIKPYIIEDGDNVIFNYFSPKQMAEVYMWLDGGNLHFELTKDEEGQYSLHTKCDIQELDGMFVMGGEEHDLDTIVDTIPVYLKGHKVSEVRIEGIDADLLNADFTWKLAEIDKKISGVAQESTSQEILEEVSGIKGDNPDATNSKILDEVRSKLTPLEAVLTELNNGKQEMVAAIKLKGGNSNADKSLSEIASDVLAISNVDKTFNEVDFFMARYGLSKSPLQLIQQHYDSQYTSYICYVVDAGAKININRSAYIMYTANGAKADPEGEFIIPEWENGFGYFIFAYKSASITWENYGAYFIGMYGATTTLDNKTLDNFMGIECDGCNVSLGEACFKNRRIDFVDFRESKVSVTGKEAFYGVDVDVINLPQIEIVGYESLFNSAKVRYVSMNKLEFGAMRLIQSSQIKKISLNSLRICNRTTTLYYCYNIKEIYLPSLETKINGEEFCHLQTCKRIRLPKCTHFAGSYQFASCNMLIDIEVGEIYSTTDFSKWDPTNVLLTEDGQLQIDKNIREHIAAKIKDLTGSTAQTFTFSQNIRNIMTEETEQAFAAKNWNIAPAKSV